MRGKSVYLHRPLSALRPEDVDAINAVRDVEIGTLSSGHVFLEWPAPVRIFAMLPEEARELAQVLLVLAGDPQTKGKPS